MKLILNSFQLETIKNHCKNALSSKPRKAFGLLFGTKAEDKWEVKEVINEGLKDVSRESEYYLFITSVFERVGWPQCDCPREDMGFVIDPQDVERAIQSSKQRGLELLGIYHLHPCEHRTDQSPELPSKVDIELAVPDILMMIVYGTRNQGIKSIRAFMVKDRKRNLIEEAKIIIS